VRLAVEAGCNAVATTFGVLGAVSRRWAHRIPFIVKVNHNELMTYPNTPHGFNLLGANYKAQAYADAFARTEAALKRNMN